MRLVDSIRWSLCCESISLPLWQPSPSSRGTTLPNSAGRSSWVAPGSNPKHNICTLYLNCDVKSTKTKRVCNWHLPILPIGTRFVRTSPCRRESRRPRSRARRGGSSWCVWCLCMSWNLRGLLLLPSLQQVPPPGVIFKSKNVWKKGNWIALQTGFDMLPGNSFPPHFRRSTNAINFFAGRKVLEHRSVAPAFMPVSAVYLVVHRSTNKSCVRSEF